MELEGTLQECRAVKQVEAKGSAAILTDAAFENKAQGTAAWGFLTFLPPS